MNWFKREQALEEIKIVEARKSLEINSILIFKGLFLGHKKTLRQGKNNFPDFLKNLSDFENILEDPGGTPSF